MLVSKRIACPSCSKDRKKRNSKDCVVSQKPDGTEVFFCHHCGESGVYNQSPNPHPTPHQHREEQKMFKPQVVQDLDKDHVEFLKKRGISQKTAKVVGIFGAEKWFTRLNKKAKSIAFPYTKNGEMMAVKYRSLEGKDFTQDASGSTLLFNIDNIDKSKPLIFVEGEIDALTLIECGIDNVVSVPTGAPIKVSEGKVDPSEDKRFQYIWQSHEVIKECEKIIIATDNDTAGQALAEELARRIGKDKCHLVEFDGHKDFNEVLLKSGKDEVKKILDSAKPYPVEGLLSPADFLERLNNLRSNGTGKGKSTGYKTLDDIYTVVEGQLTVVTGYPSSGKSNFVDQLMVNLGSQHDWKFAVCSFENAPETHIARLMEIRQKKRFFEGKNQMNKDEYTEGFEWVNNHFIFLTHQSSEPSTIDSILERLKVAVARDGVRGAVIDPYNYIIMDKESSETESISNMLTRIQSFAKAYGCHIWFVAHPAKMQRYGNELPRPDGMAISGSMAWWAKADVGLTVHRQEKITEVICWKCRYRWVGKTGLVEMNYDTTTGSYTEIEDPFG